MILFSLSSFCFSQNMPRVRFGTLDTNRVSVEEFNDQTGLTITKGYKIDSAMAYFSGANFSDVHVVNLYPHYDSLLFFRYKKSVMPGSVVSFDVSSSLPPADTHFKTCLNYFFYGLKKVDTFYNDPKLAEFKRLLDLKYIKGIIYFSGEFFPNVVSFYVNPGNLSELKKYFERAGRGTTITFENVYYLKDDKTIDTINRTFK